MTPLIAAWIGISLVVVGAFLRSTAKRRAAKPVHSWKDHPWKEMSWWELSAIQQVIKDYEAGFYPRDGRLNGAADAVNDIARKLQDVGASEEKIAYAKQFFGRVYGK